MYAVNGVNSKSMCDGHVAHLVNVNGVALSFSLSCMRMYHYENSYLRARATYGFVQLDPRETPYPLPKMEACNIRVSFDGPYRRS